MLTAELDLNAISEESCSSAVLHCLHYCWQRVLTRNPKTRSDETIAPTVNSLQLFLCCGSNVPYSILNFALHRLDLSRCAFGQGVLFAKLVDILVRFGYAIRWVPHRPTPQECFMCGEIVLCFRYWQNGSFMWLCYATFWVLAEVPSASERPGCLRFVMDKFGGKE